MASSGRPLSLKYLTGLVVDYLPYVDARTPSEFTNEIYLRLSKVHKLDNRNAVMRRLYEILNILLGAGFIVKDVDDRFVIYKYSQLKRNQPERTDQNAKDKDLIRKTAALVNNIKTRHVSCDYLLNSGPSSDSLFLIASENEKGTENVDGKRFSVHADSVWSIRLRPTVYFSWI